MENTDEAEALDEPTGPEKDAEEKPGEEAASSSRRRWAFFRRSGSGRSAENRQELQVEAKMETDPMKRTLHWEFSVAVSALQYVGSESDIRCFLSVGMQPCKPLGRPVKLLTQYSPCYRLEKGGKLVFDQPRIFYQRKAFKATPLELGKLELKIGMWKVSRWTFNSFYGVGSKTLEQIMSRESQTSIRVREALTQADRDEKKKNRRPVSDVGVVYGEFILEELFDVKLFFESWKFFPKPGAKIGGKNEEKQLKFIVPKNFRANPAKSKNCQTASTNWRGEGSALEPYTWKQADVATLRATRRSLQQMYFLAKLYSSKKTVGDKHPLSKFVASAVFNFQSVLDVPFFKGQLKRLSHQLEDFDTGRVEGSVTCIFCPVGQLRPSQLEMYQPRTSSSVGHLNSQEVHLVVRVQKCEGLAVADDEKGSSSPFVRISWDNMMQTSPVLKDTIRPAFNHTFYFPVRFFNERVTSRRYLETAFRLEMKAKGDIQIQAWHFDEASSTSLGVASISLLSVLSSNHMALCTLRGRVQAEKVLEEDMEDVQVNKDVQWYDQERQVRWYDGFRTPLVGCQIMNPNEALVHCEAFFYPGLPSDFKQLSEHVEDTSAEDTFWRTKRSEFQKRNEAFAENYAGPFPDAIGAKPCTIEVSRVSEVRTFPCLGLDQMNLEPMPLMSFLSDVIVSQEYTRPAKLLHWIHCITYRTNAKQERTGLIWEDMWRDPQFLLFSRAGSPQDHAILLCSVLRGMSRDAFVVKGTVRVPSDSGKSRLVEHAWVMTREDGGWVTFWEPSTREMYHLPQRWVKRKSVLSAAAKSAEALDLVQKEDEDDKDFLVAQDRATDEVQDIMVETGDISDVPRVGRAPRAKQRAGNVLKGRDAVRHEMLETQRRLPIAPRPQLLTEGERATLVDWLPYDSIDVVFNADQLWANHQNHHPACITYTFEDAVPVNAQENTEGTWAALLSEEERKQIAINPVTANVLMEAPMKPALVQKLKDQLVVDSQENLRLLRGRNGKETSFDQRSALLHQLDHFIEIHETLMGLDIDFCPLWTKDRSEWQEEETYLASLLETRAQEPWNKLGTPFRQPDTTGQYRYYSAIQASEESGWKEVLAKIAGFVRSKAIFPTMKGKVFTGFPLHFSCADKDLVRDYIMDSPEYQELIQLGDHAIFTVYCRIFPMAGGISSTWLFFGTQLPLEA